MSPRFLPLVLLAFCLFAVDGLRADFADDLARVHLEAIGGRAAVVKLGALRITGATYANGKELKFVLWARRPNLMRIETTAGGRVLTQGYDGKNPPWLMDSQTGRIDAIEPVAARTFVANADFDDPLVLREGRKISLDYGGKETINGVQVFKILVTENFTQTSILYLDCDTAMLLRRDDMDIAGNGPKLTETDYENYCPVAGVMLPFRIVQKADGQVISETIVDKITPNPAMKPGLFTRPLIITKQ